MGLWVIFLCLIPFLFADEDNQYVTFKIKKNQGFNNLECIVQKHEVIWNEGRKFFIYIENVRNVSQASCAMDTKPMELAELIRCNGYSCIIQVVRVISGSIKCTLHIQYHDEDNTQQLDCQFNMDIKYLKNLQAFANGFQIGSHTTPSYGDVQVNHQYYPKELVSIRCKRPDQIKGRLDIIVPKIDSISSYDADSVEMQMIMPEFHDKARVVCRFVTLMNTTTLLNIEMLLSTVQKGRGLIEINGLSVKPFASKTLVYMYSGVLPTVICNGTLITTTKIDDFNAVATCTIDQVIRTLEFHKNMNCGVIFKAYKFSDTEIIKTKVIPTTRKNVTRMQCSSRRTWILQYIKIPDGVTTPAISFLEKYYVEIIGGGLIFLVVILVSTIFLLKRRKRNEPLNECNYSLPHDRVQTQLESRPDQPDSAEATSAHNDDLYTAPFTPTIEDLYSKPNKKKKEVAYAEIMLDNRRKTLIIPPESSDCQYAEVRPSDVQDLYANMK